MVFRRQAGPDAADRITGSVITFEMTGLGSKAARFDASGQRPVGTWSGLCACFCTKRPGGLCAVYR